MKDFRGNELNIGDEIVINKYVCKITKMTKDSVHVYVIKEEKEKEEEQRSVPLPCTW